MEIIDTHAHLDEIEDLEGALARAAAAGVAGIIAVGQDLASNIKTLEIAARCPGYVYPALGLHPWNIREPDIEPTLRFIRDNAEKAVAIGEIGLDYHKRVRANADKDVQQKVLAQLLRIAKDHDKPALLHTRYAWRDAYDAVRDAGIKQAVFHWYTGTSGVLKDIIEAGYCISVTPAVAYHEEHRRAVKETPLSQLLLETDSPVTYARGREGEFRAEPADAVRSLQGAAALKSVDEAELTAITAQNARRLLRL